MKKIHKILIAFAVLLVAYLILEKLPLPGNEPPRPSSEDLTPTVQLSASFYPLAYLAEQISGKYGHIITITPAGIEPHDFEPTPNDIAKIYGSKIFIFNGNGLEAWADKIAGDLSKQHTNVIRLSDTIQHNNQDPHFWLDPQNMSVAADLIADALIEADAAHADTYQKNRALLKAALAQLDTEYKTGLSTCQKHEIITTHDAFSYLANRYNFTTFPILGLSPEEDPSPKKIAEAATVAKNKKISYIFFESAANPKLADTIAQETGAQTLVLNPIESLTEDELANGQNYISVMQTNLRNLKTAMVCR